MSVLKELMRSVTLDGMLGLIIMSLTKINWF